MRDYTDLHDVASELEGVDWSETPVGPCSSWDVRLRTIAWLVLKQPAPACLFWGAEGTLIFNGAMKTALGVLQAQCLGKPVSAVQESLVQAYENAFSSGDEKACSKLADALVPMMWRLLADRSGAALSCLPVPGNDGSVQGVLVQRVFDGPLAAETTPDMQGRNEFQLRLSDAMRRLDEPEDIQTTGTRMLGEFLSADRASFAEIDIEAGLAWERYEYRRNPIAPRHTATHRLKDAGPALLLLQDGMPLVIRDVQATGEPAKDGISAEVLSYAKAPFRAQLTVPVMRLDKLVSVMTVRFDEIHEWSVAEIAIAQETAIRIWEAVERARAEARLRLSEARHRTLFQSIDEGVCLFQPLSRHADGLRDYRCIAMNPAMQVMFGMPDLSGQAIRDAFPDEFVDWCDECDRVLETGEPIRLVRESEAKGMVLEMFVGPVEREGGKLLLVVVQNITAHVHAEQALRESEQRLRMAQKAAGVATFDWAIGDGSVTWSPEALGMMGLRPGAFGGSYEDWIALIHPDDLTHATEQIEWALEDGELEGEWRVRRPDGSVIWVLVRGTVERDAQNRPVRLTGAQVDVTDRVQSQQNTRALINDLRAQIDDLCRRLDRNNR